MNIIVAVMRDGAIGKNGGMLLHLPEDLRYFKRVTTGHAVIMGRKTWESLPKRPLPGRQNIVVTRNAAYEAPGATVVHSLQEALQAAPDDAFIIGGGKIYSDAMPMADRLYLTEIDAVSPDADTHFPLPNPAEWRLIESTPGNPPEGMPRYAFRVYERISK